MKSLKPLALIMMAVGTTLTAYSNTAHSQEVIALAADELQRLAIVFTPVQAVAASDGDRVPATVISSPFVAGTLNTVFEGYLQSWHVETGAQVNEGQLLATLRSEELLSAQQGFLDASIALGHADAALTRDQQLFDEGIIAEQRLQASRRDRQLAATSEASTRRLLMSAGFGDRDLTALHDGSSALGQYQLRAPAAGVVSQRLVQAGSQVRDGEALVAIRGDDSLWVSARIPARMAGGLTTGSSLTLADTGNSLTLRQMDGQIDSASQTLGIQAEFDDNVAVMPGQLVTLILPPAERGVRVPAEAVVHAGEETTVYVRTANGADARVLQLTPSGRHYIAVSGLSAGEEVAVQGAAVLKGIQLGLGGADSGDAE